MGPYFLGIDVGTQGARVVLLGIDGHIAAQAEKIFPLSESSREEQSPELWWECCLQSIQELKDGAASIDFNEILSIGVTSTSGTIIPLDKDHRPLHNALMYSDKRSASQGEFCTAAAAETGQGGFTAFNSSSGLAKMVWFIANFPQKVKKIHSWVHAADYITGKLSGRWGITDYTNAFKSGYDVTNMAWPDYLFDKLPLKKEWMPEVYPSGHVIGTIDPAIAGILGLPLGLKVAVGITDGCASQIASGAIEPGDWNTTIGTTMVIKGVTEKEIIDAEGRIYSHRHPAGYWMPGGASNTGADWVTNEFGDKLAYYNACAAQLLPTSFISYPLRQKGERFPMVAPAAAGFEPEGLSPEQKFTANMEGVAYLERYAYELISHLSGEKVKAVFTAGGGSNSESWLKIRSNVLNLPIFKMKEVSGAVGAAISSSSQTYFGSIIEAVKALTLKELNVYPEDGLAAKYNTNYQQFLAVMIERGFIKKEEVYA